MSLPSLIYLLKLNNNLFFHNKLVITKIKLLFQNLGILFLKFKTNLDF